MVTILKAFLAGALFVASLGFLFMETDAYAAPFLTAVGGTGTTTPSGILYGDNGATNHLNTVTIGANLTFSGGTLSATGGGSSFGYPFTLTSYGAATSTTIGFLGGLFTQGSTTISSLGSGTVNANNGLLYSSATTTLAGSGVVSISNAPAVFGSSPAVATLTGGTNGQILGWLGGIPTWTATTTFSSGLAFSGGNVTNTGVLSNIAGAGISVSGATGNVTITNTIGYPFPSNATTTLLTLSNGATIGNPFTLSSLGAGELYTNSTGLVGTSATTTVSCSGSVSCSSFTTFGTSPFTITGSGGGSTGLSTTSPIASSNLLVYSSTGAGSAFGVATSTLTASSPLTGSFTQIGSGGALGCQTASGSQAGCLSSADWTTFNGKLSGNQTITLTGAVTGSGATSITTTFGSISAGVLGTPVTGIPTSQATSTLYGASTGGMVLGWNNNTGGIAWVATSTGGGSGTVTSVALTAPTGTTITGSPVTTTGTLGFTLNTGFSIKELPSWTVCSSGCDFTTIQAALNAASSTNGTNGGGTIYLTDAVYSDGSTALLIKSPNTTIVSNASTTINFTGATTLFKSDDAADQFSNVTIQNLTIVGDGTAGSVAIDGSNMSHSKYVNNTISTVGSMFVFNDTQNITFYNTIESNNGSTISQFGINASSTNPWNGNRILDNFIGCSSASCVGIQLTNANGDDFTDNKIEPASANNTKDILIFDNHIATCNGVFNNIFDGNYIEGGKTTGGTQGVSIATDLCGSGGIQRNTFSNNVNENHNLDWAFPSATSTVIGLQTFNNDMDSNFGKPLTSFQGPFGIGTSTELEAIGATGPNYTYFGISPVAGVATNDFTIGSSSATLINVNNAGQLQVDNGGQINQVTSGTAIPLQVEANSSGDPIGLSVFDNGFANTSDLVKINQVNGSDTGPALHILDAGTGPALYVQTGNSGFGTSTPQWEIEAANATKPQLSLSDGSLTATPWTFRSINSNFYLGTSSPTTFATSTNSVFSIVSSATADATTTFSLTDWVLKQTSQTAFNILDAFGTHAVGVNTASTTGNIEQVDATTTPDSAFWGNCGSPSATIPSCAFAIDSYGHLMASTTSATPTVSCTPSGGTLSANSNDDAGTITGGTLSTSCTVTFAHAYGGTPVVETTGSNVFTGVTAQSTTAFTASMMATTGDVIQYFVVQP